MASSYHDRLRFITTHHKGYSIKLLLINNTYSILNNREVDKKKSLSLSRERERERERCLYIPLSGIKHAS